jgi:hypothetical protein
MAKTLEQLLAKISLRKLEEASVVFKETQQGSEYYEVLKTRDPMLTLGGQYSEDLVKYYVLTNEKVVVLSANEDLCEEEQPLKVGDYAKIRLDADPGMLSFDDIVRITDKSPINYDFRVERIIDGSSDAFDSSELEKATDEEVAEAKRQKAETETKLAEVMRWAKIGRKPKEFKVGDAVRYKNAFTTVTESKRGLIRINQSNHETRNIEVHPAELTLVFPVGAKFDGGHRP